ncbi:MAG: hypothetical protein N2323_01115 [candidate division WOR-3 bacterium]|nr:hypothetical protein [candidate division WOR-3 bacterium]MCX7836546.1 hypothetical protein [candidate division WOR-3 bacterium]MDW8113891.1 hypothetical protein [candidate division WOR-3 bacterium]
MRQRVIILIGILVVLLVFFTLLRPKPKSKISTITREIKPKVKQEAPTATAAKEIEKESVTMVSPIKKETLALVKPSVKKETLELKPIITKKIEEDTEKWGDDPFVRDFSYLAEMKSLIVSAITISEKEAYAIINNQVVYVGDVIEGKKVVAIERDKVIVEKGGKRFPIFLGE